jgi:hypothetical protein
MAEKRMFAKTIVLSDAFLDMPLTARCLYFTLGMLADDDGFVNSPKSIIRQCGASVDDLKVLLSKKFLLAFESGVIVIKHWRINNYLRNDRYHETAYISEKNELLIDEQGIYHKTDDYEVGIPSNGIPSNGIPSSGIPREDKIRLDKIRLDKISIGEGSETAPPSADEEEEHSNTRHNFQEVTKAWNELKPFGVNSVTKVVPTTERGKCLKARIADYGLDDVLKAIDLVKQSKFLQGNNDRDWKITFDWFVKPNNFIKVLEGNYTDTKPDNPNNFENRTFATAKERQMAEWEATFGSFDD